MSDLAYADNIMLEAVNRHATAVGRHINASKTKLMSARMPGEQRQAVLLDGEPWQDVDKFKYLGSMFIANVLQSVPKVS